MDLDPGNDAYGKLLADRHRAASSRWDDLVKVLMKGAEGAFR